MKLFIAFICICFVSATLLHKRPLKANVWMLFGLALLVSIGYYFFDQI